MRKIGTFILGILMAYLNIAGFSAMADTGLNLADGEICLNSMQCKSAACVHDTVLGIARCAPQATEGEACSPKTIYGIYYHPRCERGLSCEDWTLADKYPEFGNVTDGYGRCIYVDDPCVICNFKTAWTSSHTGYVTRKVGSCGSATDCSLSIVQYRCAPGYYGIDPVKGSATASGCTICPANATCPAGDNLTFRCVAGYYRNGLTCNPCPVENGLGGTSVAGATSVTECYFDAGTHTDNTGTFEIPDACPYIQ